VIAENMYAQCDIEGRKYNLMEGIIDQKTDGHAITPTDMYIKHGSNKKLKKTTKGSHLCVDWKDGTTIWERLVYLKESNPVEVAEYAASKSLLDTPAFVWRFHTTAFLSVLSYASADLILPNYDRRQGWHWW
jgi:hypothetical protein